ncbi:MAG TPA: hypothetical protein DCZ69_02570 [Syntrophobacteraceae bacterium]|nr:hypothetical protein [Syntrophobacteraceae bacterium]HBD07120.1 hypothetical protein [Syntrophobacteraceae bacterium]HBZ55880.1 hypothetical protein [Syntrophobacteraceae bacterium]
MNGNPNEIIMNAREPKRAEDSLVETLEVQRQVEPLNLVQSDETGTAFNNTKEDAEAVADDDQPDELMENVRAFIRSIDINAL